MLPHEKVVAETIEWYTPPWLLQQLGEFDLDPCAPIHCPFGKRIAEINFTTEDNGLIKTWPYGSRVFLNPPYGREIKFWMEKMASHNNGIALTFARVDTEWFHKYVFEAADSLFFFKGRIKFFKPDGNESTTNGGAPSVLIAYDNRGSRENREKLIFLSVVTKGKLIYLKE